MKTFKFSQRVIILASIFFLDGFVSLIFTELSRGYVGIIFILIPTCLITQVADFEKKIFLQMFLAYGLAFAIYNLDTNLYIAKFIRAESLLNYSNWMHWFGVLLTGFISLIISTGIIWVSNPKFMDTKPYIKKVPAEI